jgi:hypothetical protein
LWPKVPSLIWQCYALPFEKYTNHINPKPPSYASSACPSFPSHSHAIFLRKRWHGQSFRSLGYIFHIYYAISADSSATGEPTARTDIYAVVPTIRWEALSHERERFTAGTRKIGEGARTGLGRENPSFFSPAWSPRPPTGCVSTLRYETKGFGSGGSTIRSSPVCFL